MTATNPPVSQPDGEVEVMHPTEVVIQQWRSTLSPDSFVGDEDAEDLLFRLIASRAPFPGFIGDKARRAVDAFKRTNGFVAEHATEAELESLAVIIAAEFGSGGE